MRPPKRRPLWLGVVALVGAGLVFGSVFSGAPSTAVLGTLAAVFAAGAALYRPALGLAVLAFTYPFDLTTAAGPFKVTTSAGLMGILGLVWLGRQVLRNPPAWHRTRLDVPVMVFAAATALSLLGLFGLNEAELVGLVKAAGGFVLFFIVTQSLHERREVWLVVAALVASGLIQSVQTVVPVLTGSVAVSVDTRATGATLDPNTFSGYLVLVIPLVLTLGLLFQSRLALIPTFVVTALFVMALVATLSRSGWIGLIVALVTLVLLIPSRRLEVALVSLGLVAVLLVAGLAAPIGGRLGPQDSPFDTFQARVPIWQASAAIWSSHPVFGIGVANLENVLADYNPDLGVNQAEDLFLNMGVERGIIGLSAFVVVIVILFRVLSNALKRAPTLEYRILAAGLISCFTGYFAHALVEVSYYDYKILLLFWLLVAVAVSLPRLFLSPLELEPARA